MARTAGGNAGLKLRVIPNPVFIETFKTFKANPVPMPFAELYGALESKAVDGQENPFAVILSSKLYEVNKYVSETFVRPGVVNLFRSELERVSKL